MGRTESMRLRSVNLRSPDRRPLYQTPSVRRDRYPRFTQSDEFRNPGYDTMLVDKGGRVEFVLARRTTRPPNMCNLSDTDSGPLSAYDSGSDWEAPCGAERFSSVRQALPELEYVGRTLSQSHWTGQPCYIIAYGSGVVVTVVFACGCLATVPMCDVAPSQAHS
jgi:hypothetical protein